MIVHRYLPSQTRTVSKALLYGEAYDFTCSKCLDGKVCRKFNECFEFNHHNKSSRNNVLLNIPRVKLEMANAGFFFMGAKYLIPRNVSRSVINAVVFKPR